MSYHGVQVSGVALILYALFALLQGGSLRDTAEPFVALGVLVVVVGAILDPFLEKRFVRTAR